MPDWPDADDIQLLQAVKEGDAEAFGELYERYATVIFRFTFSHMDDRMDAEDLTEDIFLRVWRSLPNYREQGVPFVAYLFRVARNALIDHYRHSSRNQPAAPLEDFTVGDSGMDTSETVLSRMERQEIRQFLGQLREDYRTVLVLRFLAELSPDETAVVMGKTAGAVRVLQHRALAALRKILVGS